MTSKANSDAEEWINFSFKATLTGPGLQQRRTAAGMGLADAWANLHTVTSVIMLSRASMCLLTCPPRSTLRFEVSLGDQWVVRGPSRTEGAEEIHVLFSSVREMFLLLLLGKKTDKMPSWVFLWVYLLGCMDSLNMDICSFESAYMNWFLACTVCVSSVLPLLNIYISEVFLLCIILGENIKPAGICTRNVILDMTGPSLTPS